MTIFYDIGICGSGGLVLDVVLLVSVWSPYLSFLVSACPVTDYLVNVVETQQQSLSVVVTLSSVIIKSMLHNHFYSSNDI